jgi:hypothetical protein
MEQLHEAISRVMDQLGLTTELPPADKNEDLDTIASRGSPSNPGPRTPSQPGRSTDPRGGARRSSPGRSQPGSRPRASAPGRPRSAPGRPQPRAQEPEEQATLPATALQKSRAPLIAALVAGVVLLLGVIGYLVKSSLTAAQEARVAADEVVQTRKAAVQQPPQPEPEPVYVVVVTDPVEARVRATWKGGEKEGTAPLSIDAPHNARIHLEITKSGYLAYQADLVADVAQTVSAKMTALAIASPTPTAQREPDRASHKAPPQKKKKKSDLPNDGLIDIGDALK